MTVGRFYYGYTLAILLLAVLALSSIAESLMQDQDTSVPRMMFLLAVVVLLALLVLMSNGSRYCRSAAPPCHSIRCFNGTGAGMSAF